MMGFADKSSAERMRDGGAICENVFEQVCTNVMNARWTRFGFDRPDVYTGEIHPYVMGMPDYLVVNRDGPIFWECQGFGRDRILKVKQNKLETMRFWNTLHPVHYFMYNSSMNLWATTTYHDLFTACNAVEPDRFSNDRNLFYPIDAVNVFSGWTDYGTVQQR